MCLLSHPIPSTNNAPSAQIIIPQKQVLSWPTSLDTPALLRVNISAGLQHQQLLYVPVLCFACVMHDMTHATDAG